MGGCLGALEHAKTNLDYVLKREGKTHWKNPQSSNVNLFFQVARSYTFFKIV
jgi:hypothetical protein